MFDNVLPLAHRKIKAETRRKTMQENFNSASQESKAKNRARVLATLVQTPYEGTYTPELKWSLEGNNGICNFGDQTDAERFVQTYLARSVHGDTSEDRETFFEKHESSFEITKVTEEDREKQVAAIASDEEKLNLQKNYVTLKVPLDLIDAETLIKKLRVMYNNGFYIGDREPRPFI